MIKGVIFDLDGTLCDTLPDLGAAMNKMLSDFGYPTRSREELRLAICYGAREFVLRSLPEGERDEETVTQALSCYRENYKNALTVKTLPYIGIRELLEALMDAGVPLAVYSNKPMEQTKTVVAHYFPDIPFAAVVGHVDGTPTKPDPTAALAIAEKMGFSPKEIAFVGDSDVDMRTGRNAGMVPIGVTWGYRDAETLLRGGAEHLAADTEALLALLCKES